MFAETDVQSEPESMSVVILIVFFDFSWRLYFPAPFKIRLTARVIARYVYSRCSWIGVFPSCCVDSLLARKIMLSQTWRELFVVEDGEIIALVDEDSAPVVRRQLDDLLLRQIEQNYHGIPITTSSQTTSMCWIHLWWKVNSFWIPPNFLVRRYNFFHFGKNFAVLNQTSWWAQPKQPYF